MFLCTYLEYRKKGTGQAETAGAENRVPCSPSNGQNQLGEKQVCDVPVDDFNPCTPTNQYNYEAAGPCVFLKLNKVGTLTTYLNTVSRRALVKSSPSIR